MDPRLESRARTPRYSFPAAADIVGKPTNTVRRWSTGNQRRLHGHVVLDQPLIKMDGSPPGMPLSFLNLLELQMLARYRDEAGLQSIRKALAFAGQEMDVDRPLLTVQFRVAGGELFARYAAEHGDIVVNASRGGQVSLDQVVEEATRNIDYDGETAHRWWPRARETPIVVDSRIAGARPVTARSAVSLQAIQVRVDDGFTPDEIADDTGADEAEVQAALEYLAA